jgi:hypothetical protein
VALPIADCLLPIVSLPFNGQWAMDIGKFSCGAMLWEGLDAGTGESCGPGRSVAGELVGQVTSG